MKRLAIGAGVTVLLVGLATAAPPNPHVDRVAVPELFPNEDCTFWTLQLTYRPIRVITINVPGQGRKHIWYMVYRVTNNPAVYARYDKQKAREDQQQAAARRKIYIANGLKEQSASEDQDTAAAGRKPEPTPSCLERQNKPHLFVPHFVLVNPATGKSYPDVVIPAAQVEIDRLENPGKPLYNSVTIYTDGKGKLREIKPNDPNRPGLDNSRWGVAMWEDIDLNQLRKFVVYATGLSNGFRDVWTGDPNETEPLIQRKALAIYFERNGDPYYEPHNITREITEGDPPYEWVYR